MDFESRRNMGYAFINFWACMPSEKFDSMVSRVETAGRIPVVPRFRVQDWKGTVATCAFPQSWVSCSVEIGHFTVFTIRVGTEVRGDIFHGFTHGKFHCYHKLREDTRVERSLRVAKYSPLFRHGRKGAINYSSALHGDVVPFTKTGIVMYPESLLQLSRFSHLTFHEIRVVVCTGSIIAVTLSFTLPTLAWLQQGHSFS